MKKRTTGFVLAGALAAGFCMSANAEITVNKMNTLENVDLIYDGNLLEKQGNNGYALMDLEGTALTGEVYARFSMDECYIVAAENTGEMNCQGVLSQDGKQIVPCKYSEIDVLNKNWILALTLTEATADRYDYTSWWESDKYYLIDTVDVYHVAETEGVCLATLTRDQYIDSRAYGDYLNIQDRTTNKVTAYDAQFQAVAEVDDIYEEAVNTEELVIFSENGQKGLADAENNVIMEASFQYIYSFYGDYAEVSTGEKTGLIDKDGNVVIPAEFDAIEKNYYGPQDETGSSSSYEGNGYFAVVQNEKLGYADRTGTITCEPRYSKEILENNGASAMFVDMEGNTCILAADGTESVLQGYENVSPTYYASGMLYDVRNADYGKGLIDWHGKEIFPCEYSSISLTADGQYAVVTLEDYTTVEIYQINYGTDAAPAAEEAVTETATADAEAAGTEAQEGAAEETSADTEEVRALIDSAVTLLNAESSNEAVIALLEESVKLIGDGNDSAVLLLEKTIAQLGEETVDAASVAAMLDSITKLL